MVLPVSHPESQASELLRRLAARIGTVWNLSLDCNLSMGDCRKGDPLTTQNFSATLIDVLALLLEIFINAKLLS